MSMSEGEQEGDESGELGFLFLQFSRASLGADPLCRPCVLCHIPRSWNCTEEPLVPSPRGRQLKRALTSKRATLWAMVSGAKGCTPCGAALFLASCRSPDVSKSYDGDRPPAPGVLTDRVGGVGA